MIAWIDSRPGFDDTGVTAVGLALAAGVAAYVGGRLPWLWALATGIWVPLLEFTGPAGSASLAALLFSGAGAAAGWFLAGGAGGRRGLPE